MSLQYANWSPGEPNDSGNNETVGEFYGNGGTSGFWNDLQPSNSGGVSGYFCEYGGLSTDPVVLLQGSKSLVFLETAISLLSTANPAEPGASVTLTATVSPTPSSGTVTFTSSDGTPLGGPVTLTAGSAAVSTSALALGRDTITASASYVYAGENLAATAQLAQLVSLTCPTGQSACPSPSPTFCTNEQTDPGNCGACGAACPSGEACVAGSCQAQCLSGEVLCGGKCVDPATDNAYCGATAGGACSSAIMGTDYQGTACASGTVCSGGVCAATCAAGYTTCTNGDSSYCADIISDPNNCGVSAAACGNVCPSGQACVMGACTTRCPAGEVLCGGKCVDPATDNQYCGATAGGACSSASAGQDYEGAACATGTACTSGVCVATCAAGFATCSGDGASYCADENVDSNNCGACGNVCPSGELCDGTGHCALSCVTGETSCSGICTVTSKDDHNCGACGNACASGQVCDGTGHCGVTCAAGLTVCSASCTDVSRDSLNCGACGAVCSGGASCSAGTCAPADAGSDAGTSAAPVDGGTDAGAEAGEPDASSPSDLSTPDSGEGCDCRVAPGGSTSDAAMALGLAAFLVTRRRRRARAADVQSRR